MNYTNLRKLNGNALKVIAMVIMLIDHFGAGLLYFAIKLRVYHCGLPYNTMVLIYRITRDIGRSAFPIFCFLIVEGFKHTHSRLRYALSLLLFGFISEIPFDTIVFKKDVFNINLIEALSANRSTLFDRCNVFFTLLLGLLAIWGFESLYKLLNIKVIPEIIRNILSLVPGLICALIAYVIKSDYSYRGVFLIMFFYLFSNIPLLGSLFGYITMCTISESEIFALPGFLLPYLYNNKQGRKLGRLKYLFYAFYPVHIFLIYLIRCLLYG